MDIIKILRENHDLSELLEDICDIKILPRFIPPQDEGGRLTYNIAGRTFAKDGTGGEYILLEDGSAGYWGSEGQSGRMADSLNEFFTLVVNCPYWQDYVCIEPYKDLESLSSFAKDIFDEYAQSFQEAPDINFYTIHKELADGLGIALNKDLSEILMKFYHSAGRRPRLITTFTEADGSRHHSSGSLFEN